MKIEMDDNTSIMLSISAVCAAVVLIAYIIYRYNIAAYELGYTQQQLQNSQQTVWVKNK